MTHRILLADDSATIRKVVELTFSDEDFSVDSVGDGAQAFEHAHAQHPDIIISDVIMPGLNGYELCQQCKADPDLRSVPFLFLKGTFESFDEEKALSCGADGFIVKPFESQEMIAKVKDLIAKTAAPALAPAPVAVTPAPIPAEVRPVVQRPVTQQRQPASPPPLPTMSARPATAPPATRVMPSRPTPPMPQWPTRPVPATPVPSPRPHEVTPPVYQQPPPVYQPPPPPPVYQPQPPAVPPPAVKASGDEFGFDFGESDDDRFGAPAAQPSVQRGAAPALESPGESDEDLWSEVTLRGGTNDLLEDRGRTGPGVGSGADIMELPEEAALHAPEVLFEDETVFEEVSTARMMPFAPVVEPTETREETPASAATLPAAAQEPAAQVAVDQAEIERIVSSRVEAAVRQMLEPIVGDLARTMIESVAWEVIPDLAETMIRAEIERVRQSARTD